MTTLKGSIEQSNNPLLDEIKILHDELKKAHEEIGRLKYEIAKLKTKGV